jgi:hypothetical protein
MVFHSSSYSDSCFFHQDSTVSVFLLIISSLPEHLSRLETAPAKWHPWPGSRHNTTHYDFTRSLPINTAERSTHSSRPCHSRPTHCSTLHQLPPTCVPFRPIKPSASLCERTECQSRKFTFFSSYNSHDLILLCRIRGSHNVRYEEFYLLRYNAVQSGKNQQKLRVNISPQPSGLKSNARNQQEAANKQSKSV